ncbi:ATP-binding response regulator [Paenibacillus koleovorans]|uniref:ATP-binding response regulator n=1 Tax=Paenibacillus koleovorans TaxID=121608 RepID=UPI000FDA757F|nr:ATP-binding protein [Paenibacillus koleovorans]
MNRGNKGLAGKVSRLIFMVMGMFGIVVLVIGVYMNDRISTTRETLEVEMGDQLVIEKLHNEVQALVSDIRGFVAYERQEFLDSFNEKHLVFENSLLIVKDRLAQTDSVQSEKMKLLEQIGKSWEAYEANALRMVALKQQQETEVYLELSKRMTSQVNEINIKFNELGNLQEIMVDKLIEENRQETGILLYVPVIVVICAAAAGWLLVQYLRRKVILPLVEAQEAVQLVAAGSHVVLELDDRKDELGRLKQGINSMSATLQERRLEQERSNSELVSQRDLLEAQNEEITAQQLEQEEMLSKLTERERDLELINSYQEKLAGHVDMGSFLTFTIQALLKAVRLDAAVLIMPNAATGAYDVKYGYGYPKHALPASFQGLYGVGLIAKTEKRPIYRTRTLSGEERGIHGGYEKAIDFYCPLLGEKHEFLGLLLLTSYGDDYDREAMERLTLGLVRQFALAYMAQLVNEDRRKQAELLEELNDELQQEKESLQEQRDFVRQIVESVHEGMVLCDKEGRIRFTNGWMGRTFRFEESDPYTIHEIFNRLLPLMKNRAQSIRELSVSVLNGELESLQEKFTLSSEEGPEQHYELYVNPIQNGVNGGSFLFVFRDRTNEERSDEMKNEFISIVSHELRTPLASILGFMEILLNRDIQKERQKKYMETIYKEANRLSSLINDFLDLQRMESGKQSYQFVPLDLGSLVRDVVEQWQGKMNHRLQLVLPERGTTVVLADHDRMTQVFHNLLSNAVKYSPDAEIVDVRLFQQGKKLVVEVQDYGLGIPESSRDKMFAKFYRVDNSDRRQIGGTGLGLSIVKEIVESHRGSLSYESELGQGTTFRVVLDAYSAFGLEHKVAIVEDDENLGKLIAVSFEKLQLPTVQLKTAEAAIYALGASTERPLLCIVDIQLDGPRSGWDFIAELLKRPAFEGTPIIVSTVLDQPKHFYETETERFLKKPFTVERLLELAEQLLVGSKEKMPLLFPIQNEEVLAQSLKEQGIRIKGMLVKKDIIEVEVRSDD